MLAGRLLGSVFFLVQTPVQLVVKNKQSKYSKYVFLNKLFFYDNNSLCIISYLCRAYIVLIDILIISVTNISFSIYAPSFLEKFYESHVIQMQVIII